MKRWQSFLIVILIVMFVSTYAGRNLLASFVWYKYRFANIAITLDRRDANLAMVIGNYNFGVGAYDLGIAERSYRRAIEIDPKIPWGHYQLARIYFVKGELDRALDEITTELNVNQGNQRSLYVRGLIYGYRLRPGDLALAEQDFRHFIEWAPKEWAGYNDLAWIQSKRSKYEEAAKTIRKALVEVPDGVKNPWLWNSLGVAELNLGNYASAKEAFMKAKEFAGVLKNIDWIRAYPGNDAAAASSGIDTFRRAIDENIRRTQKTTI